MAWRTVCDTPWNLIAAHLAKRRRNPRGGHPMLSDRQCFEGIL